MNSAENSSPAGLWHLSSKLAHALPEVRHRSLQNLVFKVNHGLAKQAAQDETFLQNLLSWFQHDNRDASNCAMLDMLCKLLQQQGVAFKLCSLGILPALELLQESHSPEVQRRANKTLTALMQSEPDAQPFSANQSSQYIPRSRCQSNSPKLFEIKHQQQLPPKISRSCANAIYASATTQSCSSRASLELASQAFGSQQEVPSFGSQQRFSPRTAGSQIATSDEAAARVSSRAQWRQQSQAAEQHEVIEQGWTLPAITVGAADDQHIFDLNVRLQYSDDEAVLAQALQELQTMTAVDMPPEAILQRPSILQHVLALLKPADKASSLPKSALHFLLCFVCRVKQALSMAVNPEFVPTASGHQQAFQEINCHVKETLQWSYPPSKALPPTQQGQGKLSVLASALADVTGLQQDEISVTGVADSIAVHVLQLLHDSRRHGQIMVLMHELQPLLVPPDNYVSQPISLQRFKHYFEVMAGAVRALQANAAAAHGSQAAQAATVSENCCHWSSLTGPAVNVLSLVAQMTAQLPVAACHEVLPGYLTRTIAGLLTDPFASACLPELRAAMQPLLQHLQPRAADLLIGAALAASQSAQLEQVLQDASQVLAGDSDPAAWLCKASACLPALTYMPAIRAAEAVAAVVNAILESPALCSPLAGLFTKTACLVSTLLTSHMPYVLMTAYKTLAGAASVGPPALRSRTCGLLCESTLLLTVIIKGLSGKDSRFFSAQLLQAVAMEGSDEGRASLAPWLVWLACYELDHVIGGTIAGVIDCLQNWRASSVGLSHWEQLTPHLIGLFRQDKAARQAAAGKLAARLGLTSALRELSNSPRGRETSADPFCKLLDGGIGAPATAFASQVSQQFSQRDVAQLKSILCMPSLNPDIRRAAAEQLLTLAPDHRFALALSDSVLLLALHQALTSACTHLSNGQLEQEEHDSDGETGLLQQQLEQPNMQLPIACLHLLAGIAQHCSEGKSLLLQEADRLLTSLLPFVFSPLATVRRGMASLLMQLLFASPELEQQGPQCLQQKDCDTGQHQLCLAACFTSHFCFPCKAQTFSTTEQKVVQDFENQAQVMRILQQQKLLQAAGGPDGLAATLQSSPGSEQLPADVLGAYSVLLQSIQPLHAVPAALQRIKDAKSHADCLSALQHLGMLCSILSVARLAAASSWVPAVEHLLSHAPITAEDCDLWLQLLPLIQTLLSTHAVQPPSLQLLALLLHQAATPVLGSRQAAQATLSLPLALTSHTDAAALFSGAQQQLQDVQLAQVILTTLSSILQEAQLLGQATLCTPILQALAPATLIPLLSKAFVSNTDAAYGTRSAALQLLMSLSACIRSTQDSTAGSLRGSEWDGAVVGCLGGVVRYVCMPNHDTRQGGFKGKQLLRQALHCLLKLVHAVPEDLWSAAWQQVGGTFWLTRLARDREAAVRVAALTLLAHLASPRAPATRRMLLQGWPEGGTAVLKVALHKGECFAVRAAALCFLAVAMTVSSSQAAQEAQLMPCKQPELLDSAPPTPSSLHLSAPQITPQQRNGPKGLTEAALARLALAVPAEVGEGGQVLAHGRCLAGPLFLQSEFAARQYTQDIWDFGVEQLLLQGSFWEQLPEMLQVDGAQPRFMTALTAVVLQAAIADPDLVHAHLADHNCWPALLAVCTSQPSTAARQHAQRVHQLSSSNSMPAPASSGSGLSTIQPEELCGSSNAMTHSRDRAAGWHAADDITPGGTDQQQPHSQTQAAKGKALDTTAGAGQHDGQGMWLGPVQATPGAASHVAQLTTCLVQSQSGSNSGMSDAYAGIDSLTALLHCYVAHASLASCPLAVPVWPAKVQQQQQQHAMLEHAAQAAAAVVSKRGLSCGDLKGILVSLPYTFLPAAALLHSPSSVVPLSAKLASCRLLASLMQSQDKTDTMLNTLPGDEDVGGRLCSGLAATYLELCTDDQLVSEDVMADRACAAAALRCVLAFLPSAKAEATANGLHQMLLNCVADTHALLALKAFQPSQPAPTPNRAQVAHTDHKQAKAAARATGGARRRTPRAKHCAAHESGKGGDKVGMAEAKLMKVESESSVGLHSDSLVEPSSEAACTRRQLLLALSLLKHLAHNSPTACEALIHAGLIESARRLWKMALRHDGLLHEVLGLLANVFPGCPLAQRAFASNGNPSVLQRTLELIMKPNLDLPTFQLGLSVISNLAASGEGAALLLKSSLLAKVEQQLHHLLPRRDGPRTAALLEPLVNLAAHAEGQKQLLRTASAPGLLDLSLTAANMQHSQASASALLLLRNLALAAENKVHFVANPRVLPVLLGAAGKAGQNAEAGAHAAAALWALVHQGEKVKASLRALPQAQAQLQDAEAACFASHRLWLQQTQQKPQLDEQPETNVLGSAKDNMQALQALQMLLLLLEFPKS